MNAESQSQEAAISRQEVEHVAMLSRLKMTEAEVGEYADVLNRILKHFQKLDELDTEGVEPTSHPAPLTNVLREDTVRPSLDAADAVANAPQGEANCFRVPPVIQEY